MLLYLLLCMPFVVYLVSVCMCVVCVVCISLGCKVVLGILKWMQVGLSEGVVFLNCDLKKEKRKPGKKLV